MKRINKIISTVLSSATDLSSQKRAKSPARHKLQVTTPAYLLCPPPWVARGSPDAYQATLICMSMPSGLWPGTPQWMS